MMRSGRSFIIALAACILSSVSASVAAVPPPTSATCRISCTVANIVEWSEAQFSDIDLGVLTAKKKHSAGNATLTFYTNGDVTIIANNDNTAELSLGPHTLSTRYKLNYDGLGVSKTGSKPTPWQPFNTFLKAGSEIVHIPADGAVEVTLSVEASIKKIRPDNTGQYNAAQTLTACWKS